MNPQHLRTMRECIQIRRQEHAGWKGDPVLNADSFCFRLGESQPGYAEELATCMEYDPDAFSKALGISPMRVGYYVLRLRDGIRNAD